MPRKRWPADDRYNHARACERMSKQAYNKAKYALIRWNINMSDEPEYRKDPEKWRAWVRGKLEEMMEGLSDDHARVQASKALLGSLDAQLIAASAQNASQAPAKANINWTELDDEGKRAALAAARNQLAELERQLALPEKKPTNEG